MSYLDKILQNRQYWILLAALLSLIVLPAFMDSVFFANLLFRVTLSIVFFTSVSAVMTGRRLFMYGLWLALAIILLQWINSWFKEESHLIITTNLIFLFFFGYIVYRLFLVIIRSQRVTVDVIVVSVCIYLIIGIVFAVLSSTMNSLYDGAYSQTFSRSSQIYEFVYYSFITMATVGYGDISPTVSQTQALAVIMGITGQLYMTIIVAVLVGKYLQHSAE